MFSIEVDQHKNEIIDFMENKGYSIETQLKGDIIFKQKDDTPKLFLCGYNYAHLSFVYPDRTVEKYNNGKTSTINDVMLNGLFGPPCDIETFKGRVIHINGESRTKVPKNTFGPGGHMFYYVQAMFQLIPDGYNLITHRPKNTKEKFMYYAHRNCVSYREDAFDKLSSIKHVEAVGTCKNNVKGFYPQAKWTENYRHFSKYRFGLCMENKKAPGYITEKILMAFLAGAIPVYYGTEEVFDIFNRNAFIYYDVKRPEKAIARIKYLEENPDEYEKMLNEPILNDGSYEKYFSKEAVRSTLIPDDSIMGLVEQTTNKKAHDKAKIFLDVGSNKGDVLQAFFTKRHPSHSNNPKWSFYLKNYNPSEWKVYGFEASPTHYKVLETMEKKFSMLTVVKKAVWIKDNDTIELSIDDDPSNGAKNGEWGTSMIRDWTTSGGSGKKISIETIDFANFILQNTNENDVIAMKMNIEGAEFEIMEKLYQEKLLCRFSSVDMYWHPSFFSSNKRKNNRIISDVKSTFESCGVKLNTWSVH